MHFLKWMYPGIKVKRWLLLFSLGVIIASMGLAIVFNYKYAGSLEETIFRMVYLTTGRYYYTVTTLVGITIIAGGLLIMTLATKFIISSVISVLVPEGSDRLIELIFQKPLE